MKIYIYIYIYIIGISKLVTVVEGNQKASFSIASGPRCREAALLLSLNCST